MTRIGRGAVALRMLRTVAVLGARALSLAWLVPGRRRGAALDVWLAETVVALGPAFVKAAQLLSTRADLLPPRVCHALARLHDRVRPVPAPPLAMFAGAPARLLGAGSIACVYRARVAGQEVAVKVRRPGVERSLNLDLAMLECLARVAGRLPALRGVPVTGIATQLAASIRAQLDLAREAELLRDFRTAMASVPGVTVPAVDLELSTSDTIVMELVPGLTRRHPGELADEDRKRAVLTALRAVYRMLFLDGVVHCDLHPGNLYFRQDGTIVILDAGFTVRLSDLARERFAAFFYCMSHGDGPACADIVLDTATALPGARTREFGTGVAAVVEDSAGRPAAEFDLVSFATQLFDLQSRHGLAADPQFVFPILSLLVLEGTVREFHPDVDFQHEAKPFLVSALFERAVARR